ncbi:formin-2-like [Grus americana]|uniref:formin-2-like n=1 Tax=Grus americana TaxID=9117 RepID=UPI0024081708|nr:formin-2-like [Grus americana]
MGAPGCYQADRADLSAGLARSRRDKGDWSKAREPRTPGRFAPPPPLAPVAAPGSACRTGRPRTCPGRGKGGGGAVPPAAGVPPPPLPARLAAGLRQRPVPARAALGPSPRYRLPQRPPGQRTQSSTGRSPGMPAAGLRGCPPRGACLTGVPPPAPLPNAPGPRRSPPLLRGSCAAALPGAGCALQPPPPLSPRGLPTALPSCLPARSPSPPLPSPPRGARCRGRRSRPALSHDVIPPSAAAASAPLTKGSRPAPPGARAGARPHPRVRAFLACRRPP